MVDVLLDAMEAEYNPAFAGTNRRPVGVTGGVGSSSTEDKDEGGGKSEEEEVPAGGSVVVAVGADRAEEEGGGAGKRLKDISETVLEHPSHSDPLSDEPLECLPACKLSMLVLSLPRR